MTIFNVLEVVVGLLFLILAVVTFRDIRIAIRTNNKPKKKEYVIMAIVCLVALVLTQFVFKKQMEDVGLFLAGKMIEGRWVSAPKVVVSDNTSILILPEGTNITDWLKEVK